MITEFSVRNFGPFRDIQTLNLVANHSDRLENQLIVETGGLRVLKMILIYGPNASGKTAFLKAMDFLHTIFTAMPEDPAEPLPFQPFAFERPGRPQTSQIGLEFVAENVRHFYEVEFNRDTILREHMQFNPEGRRAELFTRTTDPQTGATKLIMGSTLESKKAKRLVERTTRNSTILAAYAGLPREIPELKRVQTWLRETFQPAVLPEENLIDRAIRELRTYPHLRDQVTAMLASSGMHIAGFRFGDSPGGGTWLDFDRSVLDAVGKLRLISTQSEAEPESVRRYFGLSTMLAVLLDRPRHLAIDALDRSLHHDLVRFFITAFLTHSRQSQLVATTHDLSLLAERDMLRNDMVWLTEKAPDGSARLFSVRDFDTSVLRKGSSLINAYELGKLGGRPALGNVLYDLKF